MADAKFATTHYGRLHYRTAGRGRPLLLLHATPRSSRAFEHVIPILAKEYRVIAPDTLGFGESDPLPENATMAMLAGSLIELLDQLDITNTAVLGLHTGNKIATALAAKWPQRVSELIVCGMTHSIIVDRDVRERAIQEILKANPIDANQVHNPSEKLDRLQGENSTEGIYAANYAFDFAATLASVSVPTLIVELAAASERHLARQGKNLAELVPNGTAIALERSDRDVLERFPAELADAIRRFVPAA